MHSSLQFYRQLTAWEPGKSVFFLDSFSTAFALLSLVSGASSQAQVLEGMDFKLTGTQEDTTIFIFCHLF